MFGIKNPFDKKGLATYKSDSEPYYSFDYPLFENWKAQEGAEAGVGVKSFTYIPDASLGLNLKTFPKIKIMPLSMKVTADFWDDKPINLNGVKYIKDEKEYSIALVFNLGNQNVEFTITNEKSYARDIFQGFFGAKVAETILDSFKIENMKNHPSITEVQARQLAIDAAKESYKNYYHSELTSPFVKSAILKDNVWYIYILETDEEFHRTDILYWNVEIDANNGKVIKIQSGGGA